MTNRPAHLAIPGLPQWAVVTPKRLAHIERVVALLERWSAALALPEIEQMRWASAGWWHDAMRNAEEHELREWTDESGPVKLLHGPAAAARLRQAGVTDDELLQAVAWHTVGHPEWGALGLALYAADFLEPGRPFHTPMHQDLSARYPTDPEAVTRAIVRLRVAHLEGKGTPLHPLTHQFLVRWS